MLKKVVTLLSFTTGQRIPSVSEIELENTIKSEDRIEIRIPAQLKTSGSGRIQPNLVFPFYREDSSIRVASALETYVKSIHSKRVSIQSLSRWIKRVPHKSGIDTSKSTTYSTSHTSTSAAEKSAVSIDLIRKTVGWTASSRIIAKFYDRRVEEDRFIFAKLISNSKASK